MPVSVVLWSLLWTDGALASVPVEIPLQGRLMDATGVPIQGAHQLTAAVYDSRTATTALWTENLTVTFENGYFAARLGDANTGNPIDDLVLDADALYVGLSVDGGKELDDRLKISSVPYARRADVAVDVVGSVDATEIRVNGNLIVGSDGVLVAEIGGATLGGLSCQDGEIPLYSGSDWVCADGQQDWDELVDVPADLLDGDDDTLASLDCAGDEIPRWDEVDAEWTCSVDRVLTEDEVLEYVVDNPIDLAAGSTVGGLALLAGEDSFEALADSCSEGLVPKLQGGVWVCAADENLTNLEVKAMVESSGPVNLPSGSQVGGYNIAVGTDTFEQLRTGGTCDTDEIPKIDAGGKWICADDDSWTDAEIRYLLESGPPLDLPAASKVNGNPIGTITDLLVGTGMTGGGDNGSVSIGLNTAYFQRRVSSCGAGSSISTVNEDGTVTCEADTLDAVGLTCNTNQAVQWNGSAFRCAGGAGSAIDADTVDGQHASAFALAGHNHDINALTGTLSVAKYSAYSDLQDEARIGTGSNQVAAGNHTHSGLTMSGEVAFFNRATCPGGWSAVPEAQGRTLVGLPAAGTLGATVGTPLTPQGTRTITEVPTHTHNVDPPDTASTAAGGHSHNADPPNTTSTSVANHTHAVDPPNTTSSNESVGHTHSVDPPNTSTNTTGSHSHPYSDIVFSEIGGPVTAGAPHRGSNNGSDNDNASWEIARTTSAGGNHAHTVDIAALTSGGVSANHTHDVNIPSVTSTAAGGHSHDLNIASFATTSVADHTHSTDIASFASAPTGNATVDVTMPYLQLLVCQKD